MQALRDLEESQLCTLLAAEMAVYLIMLHALGTVRNELSESSLYLSSHAYEHPCCLKIELHV